MSKKTFKYLSNNGDSGEILFKGTKYAFRKKEDGTYKVMRSSDAGWNWSETLFKDESLSEGRTSGNAAWNALDDDEDEDDDLWSRVYNELSTEIGAKADNRLISNKEMKNSYRFRFDDEVEFGQDDRDDEKSIHTDIRTAKIEDNKFILFPKNKAQANFARKVAELYDVPIE